MPSDLVGRLIMQRYNLRRWLTTALPGAVALLALVLLNLAQAPAAQAQPRVVASIKPVHSLVAAVMDGIGVPTLLVRGGGSPHSYALRPSEARALIEAQVVFWVGPGLEQFLRKPLAALGSGARIVRLDGARGLTLLEQRAGGLWEEGEEEHGHDHQHGVYNPHVWLDPRNAQVLAEAIAEVLARTDPAHAAAYRANGERLSGRLAELDAELARRLAPLRGRPFLVFHDAYPYLEARYGLPAIGAISVSPERPPGARRVAALRERIRETGASCVFAEPQFQPRLVQTLLEGTGARGGTLDPLGADLPDGPELYFTLMLNLARGLTDCLGRG
jgi:zinc transport system substrate-binding protein